MVNILDEIVVMMITPLQGRHTQSFLYIVIFLLDLTVSHKVKTKVSFKDSNLAYMSKIVFGFVSSGNSNTSEFIVLIHLLE